MSYDIYIGEAVIEPLEDEDDGGAERLETVVARTTRPEAPTFIGDEMTANSNARHPGYGQWSTFCEEVGLRRLFFDKRTGLMRTHPGCYKLTPAHLDVVRGAIDKWKSTRRAPALPPGWDDPPPPDASDAERIAWETSDCTQRDPMLARLVWLEWWMAWALKHCKVPAVYNS